MDESKAREYYVKIKTLRDQVEALSNQISDIDQKTLDIREMINAVEQAAQLQEGDELLVGLTNGIFIKATAKQLEHLHLNVGADTVVKKTPAETKKILEEQQIELNKYQEQVKHQREELAREANEIEERVSKELGHV